MNQQTIDLSNVELLPSNPINWEAMAQLRVDAKRMANNRIVSFGQSDPAHLAIDMMRTKILRSARDGRWHSLGITSPTAGCGKTTIALNLAISIAKQRDLRVVLVDLDLRRPQIAKLLSHRPDYTIHDLISSRCSIEGFFVRMGDNLAVGANPEPLPSSAELLQDPRTARCLKRLQNALRADIVIYDLPPMLVSDDCIGFLPNIDLAMLVVAADTSTVAEIDVCERELSEQSKLLGVVLNKARHKNAQYDYYG